MYPPASHPLSNTPVDGAFLLGHQGLQVCELEEAVVEVVQVEDADQQEGGRDEDATEELGHREGLQAQILEPGGRETQREKGRETHREKGKDT